MLKQKKLVLKKPNEAQELFSYMEHKVKHYEDILEGNALDNTNMAAEKLKPCE